MGVAATRGLIVCVTCLSTCAAVGASLAGTAVAANPLAQRVTLGIDVAGQRAVVPVCGRPRFVLATAARPRVTVRVATRLVGSRAQRARVRGKARPGYVVERCSAGRWVAASRYSRARADGRLRVVTRVIAGVRSDDFRIRAVAGQTAGRRQTASPPIYVHVGAGELVDLPVSFAVRNVNDSKAGCDSDGRPYTVRGHIAAPRASLDGSRPARAIAAYAHGLAYGEFFFRFRAVPGYDYAAEQARAGHASLTFDLPGYDSSDKPSDGRRICYGSEATMVHQMITALRSGSYGLSTRDRGVRRSFQRIALVGHSASGFTVQDEAFSFADTDALVLASFGDMGFTPANLAAASDLNARCSGGADSAKGAPGSTGYAYYGATTNDFQSAHFYNADPTVVDRVTALRNRDPCGRVASAPANVLVDMANRASIATPVLLIHGANDGLFDSEMVSSQKGGYSGSKDVTDTVLPVTGHAVTLGRTAPAFRAAMSDWLAKRGF